MKAIIELECKKPLLVARALEPEADENKKFEASVKTSKKSLLLTVESKDISGLLAGINSYVMLARTSINSLEE